MSYGRQHKASINRSYYAIFHALRTVTDLEQFDSGKHSGVITFFNRTYVKEGIFDKSISKMIDTAFRLREKAERILMLLKPYLVKRWEE